MKSLQFSIIAIAVLLSPAMALLMAIAVEIVIGILVDASARTRVYPPIICWC